MSAGATYVPIATQTVSGSSTTTVNFSSVPQTYTDIVLVSNGSLSHTGSAINFRVGSSNSADTGTNYSQTRAINYVGNSNYVSSDANITLGSIDGSSWSTTAKNAATTHFMNYANTNTYKTMLNRSGYPADQAEMEVILWRNTAAINFIQLWCDTGYIYSGSQFTLYGIASA
jgi:hypothetical protein